MYAITIVQDVPRKGCPHIHAKRLKALLLATCAAPHASSHTLSSLARALEGTSAVRHRVKQMDRLLGSRTLQHECASVYSAMARYWLHGIQHAPEQQCAKRPSSQQ
jgi:hypothetical protein